MVSVSRPICLENNRKRKAKVKHIPVPNSIDIPDGYKTWVGKKERGRWGEKMANGNDDDDDNSNNGIIPLFLVCVLQLKFIEFHIEVREKWESLVPFSRGSGVIDGHY